MIWALEKNISPEIRVSKTAVGPLLRRKSPTCRYHLIHRNCPLRRTPSQNEGSTSRIHQHTAPQKGVCSGIHQHTKGVINQRGSAARFHKPKGGLPLDFINQRGGPPLDYINQMGVRL